MGILRPGVPRKLLGLLAALLLVVAASDGAGASRVEGSAAGATIIAAGGLHTCAAVAGGAVKCWGANLVGQLGNGTTTDHARPVAVSGLSSGVQALAASTDHTCALLSSGGVKCWGGNGFGQLGDGTTADRHRPVAVSGLGSGVQAIAAGGSHSCALLSGGGVKCWGHNNRGQLGNGTTSESDTPVAVSGLASGVQAIAAGSAHTCAVLSGGGIDCWGANDDGQLGDGTMSDRALPVAVFGLAGTAQAVSPGGAHTCALLSVGGVECWGANDFGQVGDGTKAFRYHPVPVSGLVSGAQAIAAGGAYACALLSGGSVECWGRGDSGQVGDGTKTERDAPVGVSSLASGVQAIAAGENHNCAVLSGGGVKCWGANGLGELGDGTTTGRSKPVSVIGLGAQSCVVPNVRGKTLRGAENAIARAHCKTGKVSRAESKRVRKGHVISQRPAPGKSLQNGGKVSLVVSRGKK